VLGINTSAVYVGLSSGPFFGGLITQFLGWRAVFAVPIFLALIPIYLASRIKEEKAEVKDSFDFRGAVLFSLALFLLIYGFSNLPKPLGFALVFFGVAMLILFVLVEAKSAQPMLNVTLFRRNVVFAMSNLAALLNYSATFAVAFLLSLYLQIVKGLSPQDAGIILLAQPVVMAILSPISGYVSDRVEPRIVASLGMAITALALFLFSSLDFETPIAVVIAYLLLIGFGFGLFSSPNTNAVMSSVEKRFYGIASATLATMRVVGQALSMGIVTLIFAITIGSAMVSESISEFMSSMKIAFVISAILCTFGVFASLARGRIH
ncbi:MAG: MFS transporter, partial [Archaeoglobaceae archaeon]